MHGGLLGIFASVDVFFFYFFHELALIPTFIMIGIWGGIARRIAAMEMTIYLTLGALLSLLGLIALYWESGAQTFDLIELRAYLASQPLRESFQGVIFPLLLFGFGILVSLFPFHSWAPRGYAAAPTATAMLHAGVLKKFGLYGLLQIAVPLIPAGAAEWAPVLAALAIGNVLIIGLITMAQRDLKQLLGFSSVMHMGYIFLGIMSFSVMGHGGAVLLMFAHGLSVALLFLLADCIKERTHTFDMMEMGGLASKAPILAAFFTAAMFASVGLPGFANFWGEFTIFVGLWQYSPILVVLAAIGIIISAIYGLRAVSNVCYGMPTEAFLKQEQQHGAVKDLNLTERLTAGLLFAALLFVGIYPKPVTDPINEALDSFPTAIEHTVEAP
jgi:NADH-quinone oxidoreductase subunit M